MMMPGLIFAVTFKNQLLFLKLHTFHGVYSEKNRRKKTEETIILLTGTFSQCASF